MEQFAVHSEHGFQKLWISHQDVNLNQYFLVDYTCKQSVQNVLEKSSVFGIEAEQNCNCSKNNQLTVGILHATHPYKMLIYIRLKQ